MAKETKATLKIREPEMLLLSKLRPAPYNPRVMPESMMRSLVASLKEHGMVLNLVVQKRSAEHGPMVIIGGHQRLAAMHRLCEETGQPLPERVPAVVMDLDDARAKRLNVALNRVEGEFVDDLLAKVLADAGGFDEEQAIAMGFASGEELQALIQSAEPPALDVSADALEAEVAALLQSVGASGVSLLIEFDDGPGRDEARDWLKARAKAEKKRAGNVLLDLIKHAAKN